MAWKPQPNRPQDSRGRSVVSAAELEQFRRQFGQDKELRDLLNADKGLVRRKTPESKSAEPKKETPAVETRSAYDQRARGQDPVMRVTPPKEKSPFGTSEERAGARSMMAARKRADEFESDLAEKRRREDLMRPGRDAIEPVYPELMIAGPGAIGARSLATGARSLASRAAPERAAAPAAREAPAFDLSPVANPWRYPRVKAEREAAQVAGRRAEEDYVRDVIERGAEMGMKKGGKVKAYAKGGAVRGGGIEKRGKTKGRFV